MAYRPIESYGVIGDMHTVALVSTAGSIDWFCPQRFDAPSVFARLLDDSIGGACDLAPDCDDFTSKQLYWPGTNVLVTRFFDQRGSAEIADFMPVGQHTSAGRRIIRRLTGVRGSIRMRLRCAPAFDYARARHTAERDELGVRFTSSQRRLRLIANVDLDIREADDDRTTGPHAEAAFELREGDEMVIELRDDSPTEYDCPGVRSSGERVERNDAPHDSNDDRDAPDERGSRFRSDDDRHERSTDTDVDTADAAAPAADADRLFHDTVGYWRRWLAQCTYQGRWRETVHRSALALKLLTYQPTGAIIAAPTCSLPEHPGGERNWDYRYTWVRDAAFCMYALLRLGFADESRDYMRFLERHCDTSHSATGPLQIMYGIDGRATLDEQRLDHLEGYRGSSPVRIGNDAYKQLQLDIYGELLDAAYLFNKWGEPVSYEVWTRLARYVDWVCDNWRREDEGVWEVRGGARHFTYSKLMCWVAVDRGIRLAAKRSFPADRERWYSCRDEIYEAIQRDGFDDELGAFTQAFGSDTLDASTLVMPLVFFASPTDPRFLGTLDRILRSPDDGGLVSNSLVYRYNADRAPDGLEGQEGAFNICTFWLVEALTRAGTFDPDRLEHARLAFERMLSFSNHLGLFAEQTGALGQALGNYPQAFTHLALISAAFNLDRQLGPGA